MEDLCKVVISTHSEMYLSFILYTGFIIYTIAPLIPTKKEIKKGYSLLKVSCGLKSFIWFSHVISTAKQWDNALGLSIHLVVCARSAAWDVWPTLKFGGKDNCHQSDECLCVCNQGAFVDNFTSMDVRLLIWNSLGANMNIFYQSRWSQMASFSISRNSP